MKTIMLTNDAKGRAVVNDLLRYGADLTPAVIQAHKKFSDSQEDSMLSITVEDNMDEALASIVRRHDAR